MNNVGDGEQTMDLGGGETREAREREPDEEQSTENKSVARDPQGSRFAPLAWDDRINQSAWQEQQWAGYGAQDYHYGYDFGGMWILQRMDETKEDMPDEGFTRVRSKKGCP